MSDTKAVFLVIGGIGCFVTIFILIGVPIGMLFATIGLVALCVVGLGMIITGKNHLFRKKEETPKKGQ